MKATKIIVFVGFIVLTMGQVFAMADAEADKAPEEYSGSEGERELQAPSRPSTAVPGMRKERSMPCILHKFLEPVEGINDIRRVGPASRMMRSASAERLLRVTRRLRKRASKLPSAAAEAVEKK